MSKFGSGLYLEKKNLNKSLVFQKISQEIVIISLDFIKRGRFSNVFHLSKSLAKLIILSPKNVGFT